MVADGSLGISRFDLRLRVGREQAAREHDANSHRILRHGTSSLLIGRACAACGTTPGFYILCSPPAILPRLVFTLRTNSLCRRNCSFVWRPIIHAMVTDLAARRAQASDCIG